MLIERFTAGVSREKFEPLPRVPTNQIRAVTTTCTAATTALLARTTKNLYAASNQTLEVERAWERGYSIIG